jgi:hemerythrin-like metal-binding protein
VQDFQIRTRSGKLALKDAAAFHLRHSKGPDLMEHFSWTDNLRTGNPMIDGDHRNLLGLVNALCDALAEAGANAGKSRAMNDLIVFTKEHFSREEAEMQRIDYVAELAHRSEHAKLIGQVVELKATLDAGGKINVPAVTSFLGEWLRHHIQTADVKLALALKAATAAA